MRRLIRHSAISFSLLVVAALAFASKGGGGDKKAASQFKNNFTPIHSVNSFTLKNLSYSGGFVFNQEKTSSHVSLNSVVTYQKGNTMYIMPYKYKVNVSSFATENKSSLQFLGVRIQMTK